jgi:hypothetical protein
MSRGVGRMPRVDLAGFTEQVEAENALRRMLAMVWPEEVEGLVPALPRALRALGNDAAVAGDGPNLRGDLGAVGTRCEHRRSRRPCHPRAISSGHERYPADNHGHSEKTVAQGADP